MSSQDKLPITERHLVEQSKMITMSNDGGCLFDCLFQGGGGKARFNVATPTNATVTCTAYVLPYNLQTKSI